MDPEQLRKLIEAAAKLCGLTDSERLDMVQTRSSSLSPLMLTDAALLVLEDALKARGWSWAPNTKDWVWIKDQSVQWAVDEDRAIAALLAARDELEGKR